MLRALLRSLLGGGRAAAPARNDPRTSDLDAPVKVILGLGNPGKEYERTRHNVGWWVVDHLADVWHVEGWRKDGESRVASGFVGPMQVRLVKPLTYMNLSGGVLRPYLRRAGWSPQRDLLVVVDEVQLPVGSYRFRARGSAGGHNGLKSIEAALGHQDYARLRIGIAPSDPRRRGDLAKFVLSEAGKADAETIRALLPTLAEAIDVWVREGIEAAMNRFNGESSRSV
ncbi:MAG TPA: aminoacyl-tRNA hydrolase [Gemmatimonadaceae bacterium]|nr:aminoacyl-tRNA hydrolase [Gemmatimonadaceae bacterium]